MDRLLLVLAELLHRQHGAFTRGQARVSGITDREIDRRLEAGTILRRAPGVFQVVCAPQSERSMLWIAHLALPLSIVSHRSAAWLHGWWSRCPRPELSIPYRCRAVPPGAIVHRRRPELETRAVTLDGLRVTRPEVTVLDMAALVSAKAFTNLVDDFAGGSSERVERLGDWFRLVCGRGVPGSARARAELERRIDGDVAESRLERHFLRTLDEAALPRPVLQWTPPWDAGRRVDGAYVDAKILIELDGRRFHGTDAAFEEDRRRDQLAAAHGWRTLRFTWSHVRLEPQTVTRLLEAALAIEL